MKSSSVSSMGQFSRIDSLVFKDRSFSCTHRSRDVNPTVPKGMNTEA